jgi:hypothetical protein
VAKTEVVLSARTAIVVAGAALAVRLAYLFVSYDGPASLRHPDTELWQIVAADPALWFGTPERMPFYALYVGLCAWLFGPSLLVPVLGQIAVDTATCLLAVRIGARFDPRAALPAGLFAALNPTQIVMSCIVLGDTFFAFFTTGALLATLTWIERPHLKAAVCLAVWAGFALLNRAMVWPLLAFAPAAMVVLAVVRGQGIRLAAVHATAFVAVCALFAAPVVARNMTEYGTAALTSQSGTHLAFWVVPLVREAVDGTPQAVGAAEMSAALDLRLVDPDARTNPFAISAALTELAREKLTELGLVPIAKVWAMGAAINILSPATLMIPIVMQLPRTGFYATQGDGPLDKAVNFVWRNDNAIYARWLVVGAAVEFALKLLVLAGLFAGFARARSRLATVVVVGWIVFLLAIYGPVASAKYRLPMEPFFGVFSAVALLAVRARRTEHTSAE